MDTVVGCDGSQKVLLTLHFDCCSFMMAYLLDSKEARHVKAVFDNIEAAIGALSFCNTFSIVLTDRGGEFQNPDALECGKDNVVRTNIYYYSPEVLLSFQAYSSPFRHKEIMNSWAKYKNSSKKQFC